MTSIMYCQHYKTKQKLISWAFDVGLAHEQGFKMAECCSQCGAIILPKKKTINFTDALIKRIDKGETL